MQRYYFDGNNKGPLYCWAAAAMGDHVARSANADVPVWQARSWYNADCASARLGKRLMILFSGPLSAEQ
jgi:hypothetical protein